MKRILGVLLAGVLLLSGCGQWQKSQKESAYHLYCLDKTGTTLVQERRCRSAFATEEAASSTAAAIRAA